MPTGTGATSKFIEKKAVTHAHFKRLKEKISALANLDDLDKDAQGLQIGELLADRMPRTKNVASFLSAILNTHETDIELRNYLKDVEDRNETIYADMYLSQLYLLSVKEKYLVLRNVLTSEKGLLMSKDGRKMLLDILLRNTLKEPSDQDDKEWHHHITSVCREFALEGKMEDVYFTVMPLLIDRVLRPPPYKVNPVADRGVAINLVLEKEGISKQKRPYYRDALEARTLEERKEAVRKFRKHLDDIEAAKDPNKRVSSYDIRDEVREFRERVKELREDLRNYVKEERHQAVFGKNVDKGWDRIETTLDGLLGYGEQKRREKMAPLEFVLEAAKTLGAPGVRFLQLLGQYIDVPERYRKEFSKVYDAIRGQSKLSAYLLLEREMPQFKDEIVEMKESIGGGSLMTVYEVVDREGRREVLKVLNPNASYQTESSFNAIKNILESVSKVDEGYSIGVSLVDEIKQWIQADISFEGFVEQDRNFRQANSGFCVDGNSYRIYVPESKGPDNKYFRREEYIDGENLTQTETLAQQGHDVKQVVSLIAQNYITQVMSGQTHSDVHPGNFRITPDKRVAILDRNFYLHLEPQDQALIGTIVQQGPTKDKAQAILEYVGVSEEDAAYSSLKAKIDSNLREGGDFERLSSVVRSVREEGYRLPLRMTLMIKNFYALDSMSRSVGFSSLNDALAYRSAA